MIKLTAETSKGRMNTIRKEKYQATKTATVTSQCCFRQLPYWWRRHNVRRKTKIISTVNGAALILNLLRYKKIDLPVRCCENARRTDRKGWCITEDPQLNRWSKLTLGQSLVTNEFSSRRGIWVPKYIVPPLPRAPSAAPDPRVFPRGGYRYLESMRWDCYHFIGAQTETPVLNTKTVDEDPAGCQRWISRKEI